MKMVISLSVIFLIFLAAVAAGTIMQSFEEPPLRNWGVMLRAYSPILLLSGVILFLSTKIRGKTGFPLRFFLEWFVPLGGYLVLLSFLTSTFDAYALGLNAQELDLYEVLLRTIVRWSRLESLSYIELYVLVPVSAAIAIGTLFCMLWFCLAPWQIKKPKVPRWFRPSVITRLLGKSTISGKVVSYGILIGITVISLLGLQGAAMVFMPHPLPELVTRLFGTGAESVPFLAGYMFVYGPSIACVFCAVEMLCEKAGKTLLAISVVVALPILVYWTTLPGELLASLMSYQLFAFPAFAVNSLVLASFLLLLAKIKSRIRDPS